MSTCSNLRSRPEIAAALKNERGASLVEAAIILIPFLMLLLGVIEFSLVLYNQQVINNSAREGARAGIVVRDPRLPDDEVDNIVRSYALNNLVSFDAGNFQIIIQRPDPAPLDFGDRLIVTVDYTYTFLVVPRLIGLLGLEFDTSIPITATARMEME